MFEVRAAANSEVGGREGGGKWDFLLGWYVLDLDLGPVWQFHRYVHAKAFPVHSFYYTLTVTQKRKEKKEYPRIFSK